MENVTAHIYWQKKSFSLWEKSSGRKFEIFNRSTVCYLIAASRNFTFTLHKMKVHPFTVAS